MTTKEMKRDDLLIMFTGMYLRTFPPINKNGNGIIAKFKRSLIMIPIHIITRGDYDMLEDVITRWQRKHDLIH